MSTDDVVKQTPEEAVVSINDESMKAMDAVISENSLNGAAQFFKMYVPLFSNLTDRLSSRELKRLTRRLVDFPLNEKNYSPKQGSIEGNAFAIGSQLINARVLMQQAVMIRQQEKEELEAKQTKENTENEQQQTQG
jgi:hypothetical protein